MLYDHPYPNEEKKETPYEGFTYETIVPVDGAITLPCQEDIQNLFRMTPLCLENPLHRQVSAGGAGLPPTTRISFRIHVFRRNDSGRPAGE